MASLSGTLHKRRGGFGKHMFNAWQPRFFVLEEGVLRYYEDEAHRLDVRGEMRLNETVQFATGVPVEGAPSRFTISLDPRDGDRWKLCAESQEELQRWAEALERHASRVVEEAPLSPASGACASPSSQASPKRAMQQASVASPRGGKPGGPKKRQVKVSAASKKGSSGVAITPENVEKALSVFAINMCLVIVALRYDITFWVTVAVANALLLRIVTKQPKEQPVMKIAATPEQAVCNVNPAAAAPIPFPETDEASTQRRPASTASIKDSKLVAEESKGTEDSAAGEDGIKYATIDGELFPIAGTTCRQPPEGSTASTAPPHTWSKGDATIFQVRSKGYKSHKQKTASEQALMDLVAVDFVKTKFNVNNMGSEVALPDVSDVDTHHPNVPPLFIVNWQLPVGQISMFATDGPGYHAVLYFKIRPEVCEELKDLSTAREAVKLFAEYCTRAPEDPAYRGRFKAMAYVDNLDQMGFPSFITSYNAKPVLIRKTGNLIRGPNYLEMDINVHSFAALAKKGISMLMPSFKDMYINIGFTIEGREDSELPECLFGCGQLHRPNQDLAVDLFEQPDADDA